jgi:hypothetical protein
MTGSRFKRCFSAASVVFSRLTHVDNKMTNWFLHLDRLLRGETTRPEELRQGDVQIDVRAIAALVVVLGVVYGLCMGSFSLMKEVPATLQDQHGRYLQLVATLLKVPALFYLTLLVTFPSLYVFNALVGSRLRAISVLKLLLASLGVNLAVLASLGPIVLFFSVSTQSYVFIQVLNVAAFTVSGVLGLIFLLQTLHRLTAREVVLVSVDQPLPEEPSALDMPFGETLGRHTRLVFSCWIFLFAVVGAQMGWVLRPFIGDPNQPFTWFRPRESNFFEAVLNALHSLLTGG